MSASALQRAASVIGSISGGGGGSAGGSGRSTPTPPAPAATLSRSTSLRNYAQTGGAGAAVGGGTAAAAAAQAGPHSLSLKVMRISAPSLVRAQDRAYFEVPDESFSLPDASESGSSAAAASARARAHASALAQDISSAEAGEMQRLYAAMAQSAAEVSLGEGPSQSNIAAAERALRSAAAADMLSNQNMLGDTAPDPALRDWPTSDVLVLPSSFGTIYLGEAFQAYICLNNESGEPVKDASLVVEIQQADKEEESDTRSIASASSSNPSTVLARVSTAAAHSSNTDGETLSEDDFAQTLLQPQAKLETTVRHDMRKPGGYVLGCTVSYQAWLPAPRMASSFDTSQNVAQGQWVERSFRKSYRFAVPTCPLTVRSKAHTYFPSNTTTEASGLATSAASSPLQDAILLEVQVRNDSPRSLVLERAWLDSDLRSLGLVQSPEAAAMGLGPPFSGWSWESLDRPWLKYAAHNAESATDHGVRTSMSRRHFGLKRDAARQDDDETGLWEDEDQWILPGDVRQFIYRLTPAIVGPDDGDVSTESSQTGDKLLRRLASPTGIRASLPGSAPSGLQTPPMPPPDASVASVLSRALPGSPAKALPSTPTPAPAPANVPLRPMSRASVRSSTPLPPPPAALPMIPLGKLDIAWRMAGSGGEPGRLQTSMLFWRREVREPPPTEGMVGAPAATASSPSSLLHQGAKSPTPAVPLSPYKKYQPRSWRDSLQRTG
ncbi:hypothetical protein OC842_002766 [Tilletia horrida]|uniref:Trafficking protein particle complex subunit 13 N-terminal domain-containing protein n=1 Tax=Tilletia horrida TaxID=155126 RepID=A0AAN6GCQ3_9BASI|nr:hypothetical protein OC842_002766 [Tilletia horrida]